VVVEDPALSQEDVAALMERFHAFLLKKQLKSTRQRDFIALSLFRSPGHLSIDDLLRVVRGDAPRVGYATVYRTLKLLTECGLASERRFGPGQSVFETAGSVEHHDHLICVECGHVLEFQNEDIEREQESVAAQLGFSLVRHKLELYGRCPRAQGVVTGACPGADAGNDRAPALPSSKAAAKGDDPRRPRAPVRNIPAP